MEFQERVAKLYSDYGRFVFTVPITKEEIQEEGKRLANALQTGYMNEKHFSGDYTLVFVQDEDDKEKGGMDILLKGNVVTHAVRWANGNLNTDEMIAVTIWAKEKGLKLRTENTHDLARDVY